MYYISYFGILPPVPNLSITLFSNLVLADACWDLLRFFPLYEGAWITWEGDELDTSVTTCFDVMAMILTEMERRLYRSVDFLELFTFMKKTKLSAHFLYEAGMIFFRFLVAVEGISIISEADEL